MKHSLETYALTGASTFPAYAEPPSGADRLLTRSFGGVGEADVPAELAGGYELMMFVHGSFEAEWPVSVHVPTALRGFRRALGLAQVGFAERLGVGRINVERWESGRARPFRGQVCPLLTLLRPLVDGPLAAGQLLTVAAAAVLPSMTRPAGRYTGQDLAATLTQPGHDHSDLAPALLDVLVQSEVLVQTDPSTDLVESTFVPLVGVGSLDRRTGPWESDILRVAAALTPADRATWLDLGRRLAR